MPKDTFVYAELKDLDAKAISAKISSGEIAVPAKGKDRDEFLRFSSMAPGSKERDEFIEKATAKPAAPAKKPDAAASSKEGVTDTPPEKPAAPPERKPQGKEGASSNLDEFFGYGTKEGLYEAHKTLIEKSADLKTQIDKLNESGGKLGRKNQDLEKQLADVNTKLTEMGSQPAPGKSKEKEPGKPASNLKIPEPPNPEDFPTGAFDDDYQAKVAQYNKDVSKYMKDLADENARLNGLIETHSTEIKSTRDFQTESTNKTVEQKKSEAWSALWSEVERFQKERGMTTTIPIDKINKAVIANDETTLKALSPKDMKIFEKMKVYCETFADFSGGYPAPRYNTFTEMAKANADIWGPLAGGTGAGTTNEEKAAIEAKRKQNDESVSAPSGSYLGKPDDKLTNQSREASVTRLQELQRLRSANLAGFDANKELYEEYMSLRRLFGIAPKR